MIATQVHDKECDVLHFKESNKKIKKHIRLQCIHYIDYIQRIIE